MAILAAGKVDSENAFERRRAVTAAKALIGEAGRYIGQQAIQLHGGMGMTDELPLGAYVKRLAAIDILFGDAAYQREQFSRLREDSTSAGFIQPRKAWKQL